MQYHWELLPLSYFCFPPVGFILWLAATPTLDMVADTGCMFHAYLLPAEQPQQKKSKFPRGTAQVPRIALIGPPWDMYPSLNQSLRLGKSSNLIGLAWVMCSALDLGHDVSTTRRQGLN